MRQLARCRACRARGRRMRRPARARAGRPASPRRAAAGAWITTSAMAVRRALAASPSTRPEQHLQPDLELRARAPSAAQRRARPAGRARRRSARSSSPASAAPSGSGSKKSGASMASNRSTWPAEVAGQARRRAHQVGEQTEQARVGAEQREQLHAGRQAADELVEQLERRVGVGLLGERAAAARGISSVSSSRARCSRVARIWPWCQARIRAATAAGSAKPMSARVASVSGSSSVPVNTRARPPPRSCSRLEQGGVVRARRARGGSRHRLGQRIARRRSPRRRRTARCSGSRRAAPGSACRPPSAADARRARRKR